MFQNHLFIIVPEFVPAGPVKGAVALANSVSKYSDVSLISIKGGDGFKMPVADNVRLIDLSQTQGFFKRVAKLKELLKQAAQKQQVASISFTFSADMANLLCRRLVPASCSVRGNLIQNYRMDYGPLGVALAAFHLFSMRLFKHVVVMTGAMRDHVYAFTRKTPYVISNFIDESCLEQYRSERRASADIRFVFLGSLTSRKQPILLVDSFAKVLAKYPTAKLDIVGTGKMESEVKRIIEKLEITSSVVMHGHLSQPYSVLSNADIFVLPSLSEGLSRASLEALHLGLPSIMRNIDGNSELISQGQNGFLFDNDAELPVYMERAISLVRSFGPKKESLLPNHCKQESAAQQYFEVVTQ